MYSSVRSVARSNNVFALDLHAELARGNQGNLFFSPYSLTLALAMTYAGARGETASEMAEVLHFEPWAGKVHAVLEKLHLAVTAEADQGGYRLDIANRLWAQENSNILPEFSRVINRHYGAELGQVDFIHRPEDARLTINDWVERQTETRISDLSVSSSTFSKSCPVSSAYIWLIFSLIFNTSSAVRRTSSAAP